MDFDDLLMLTVELLESDPAVRERYQRRFEHVLVDEYQDTNHAQYRLVRVLGEPQRNVMVVGDDDQGIYSWRGADIRNILDFERDYPDAHVVALEQNYRSTGTILRAANAVVARNRGRHPKRLWTDQGDGEPILLVACRDEHEEARLVAGQIRRAIEEGREHSEIAVFYRTNAQSRVDRGHAGARRRALPGRRRSAVLRAGRDQGRAGLPAGRGQPGRRGELRPHGGHAAARAGPRVRGTARGLRRRSTGSRWPTRRRTRTGCRASVRPSARPWPRWPSCWPTSAGSTRRAAPVDRILEAVLDGSGLRDALAARAHHRVPGAPRDPRRARACWPPSTRGAPRSPSLGGFLEEIALHADADAVDQESGRGHPDDDPQRQGPRVRRGDDRRASRRRSSRTRARTRRRPSRRSGGSSTSA